MTEMYGIPNCDTIKKARAWLAEHAIAYDFHDYKKEGVDAALLAAWADQAGWEVLLNRRGLSWRRLSDEQKADIDRKRAIALMCENPSMIKRPVLVIDGRVEVGFSDARYDELFS